MGVKILIVEDDPQVADLVAGCLIANGCTVKVAEDSLLGIQLAHQTHPDLIFLDLMLPGGGGIAVLESLRQSVDTRLTPIIVMTGTKDSALKKKLLPYGIKTYIQKPFGPEEVLQAIVHLMPSHPKPSEPEPKDDVIY